MTFGVRLKLKTPITSVKAIDTLVQKQQAEGSSVLELIDKLVRLKKVLSYSRWNNSIALIRFLEEFDLNSVEFLVFVDNESKPMTKSTMAIGSNVGANKELYFTSASVDGNGIVTFKGKSEGSHQFNWTALERSFYSWPSNGIPLKYGQIESRKFTQQIYNLLHEAWLAYKRSTVKKLRASLSDKDIEEWKSLQDCKQTSTMVNLSFKGTKLRDTVSTLNTAFAKIGNGLTSREADKVLGETRQALVDLEVFYKRAYKELFPKKKVRANVTILKILEEQKKQTEKKNKKKTGSKTSSSSSPSSSIT